MHNRGYIKALILVCAGLLIGLTAYAVISGDAPGTPDQEEQEQENNDMAYIEVKKEMLQRIKNIAEFYGMTQPEATEYLLKIGLTEQEEFKAQCEAWDRRVQEMDQ